MSLIIKTYKTISGWMRNSQVPGLAYTSCKFYPSCSEYAELAVERHGVVKGSCKALGRIVRCNPLGSGGVDYP